MGISKVEDTHFPKNRYVRLNDKLVDLSTPKIMGILNVTPDSFYDASRKTSKDSILSTVSLMINDGADMIDIGGFSTRPDGKNISEEEQSGIAALVGAKPGDAIFFAAGDRASSQQLLGAARLEIGKRCNLISQGAWEFVWIVDAPMFEPTDNGGWTAVHHPFTGPKPEFAKTFKSEPATALAYAYDIVLNGTELGGGSIRIHDRNIQKDVFTVIGLSDEEAQSKFGFLLEAFNYGPPPHGGIALGLDRVCALLTGSDSIREVIAFPKTASGGDPLTGAPTPITPAQRKEAAIDWTPPKE